MALKGELSVPGDKSISHRLLMLAAVTDGPSSIHGMNSGEDVDRTLIALQHCGVTVEHEEEAVRILGQGIRPFEQPVHPIDCGNSGTTARLMMGLLAGHPLHIQFSGDVSLTQRPMDRVIRPLQQMGANISARDQRFLPLMLSGRDLWAIQYDLPMASAQVKSALILAGLWAHGETIIRSPNATRDHTERLLSEMGARVKVDGLDVHVAPLEEALQAFEITVPGDFSAAAFWIGAAILNPGSELHIRQVGINPSRTAFLEILKMMGAKIEIQAQNEAWGEPLADLIIRYSTLNGIAVPEELVPNLIDELPLIALLASQAEGETRITGARELRIKESDRIHAMAVNLMNWGAELEEFEDGLLIKGPAQLRGGAVQTFGDHRIAMTMLVGGLIADEAARLDNAECIGISYPGFEKDLDRLMGEG